MQPNIAEECCKKNCLQRLVIDRDSYGSELATRRANAVNPSR